MSTRRVGVHERLEIRDEETGRAVLLRPDGSGAGDVPSATRNEAILGIARAARWRVAHVLVTLSGGEIAARISLASEEALIKLESRAASALRLALAARSSVSVEDDAWEELIRQAEPISSERVADFAAELDRKGADEILRELGQEDGGRDVA